MPIDKINIVIWEYALKTLTVDICMWYIIKQQYSFLRHDIAEILAKVGAKHQSIN